MIMANILKQLILIYCIFAIKPTTFAQNGIYNCNNADGRPGVCVSVINCPTIFKTVAHYVPHTLDFLIKSKCTNPNDKSGMLFICCIPDIRDVTEINPTTAKSPQYINENRSTLLPGANKCGLNALPLGNIFDGDEAELGEFSWMANLEYQKPSGEIVSKCAGNIINQRYILTAGHCVKGEIETSVGKLVSVRVGDHNTETDIDCYGSICLDKFQRLMVEKAIAHPSFFSNKGYTIYDIALIRTDRNIQYSFSVTPICLPNVLPHMPQLKKGMKLQVSGWGRTSTSASSPKKRKVELPYVENEDCPIAISENQLCAGGVFLKDTCNGDSGGGLVHNVNNVWIIEGIVSFGRGCGSEIPAVYTRVSSHISWINDNVVL